MNFDGILILLLSKYWVFAKFRTIDNNDIGILRNIEILIITKSKRRESSQFRGYRHRSFEILRNSDIVINEIAKFRHRWYTYFKLLWNFEVSFIKISEFRKISKDWCRYPRNCELLRHLDFVIIKISIFLGIPISLLSIVQNFAKLDISIIFLTSS